MEPIVRVAGVDKSFHRSGLLSSGPAVRAVRNVSLELPRGRVLGLVGESGSGKSTLGRLIVGLLRPDRGSVIVDGHDLAALRGRELRRARRAVQIVFQDSYRSLDPMMSVQRIVEEPLAVQRTLPRAERAARAQDLVERVGLRPELLRRRPTELSGGQRQRVAIARALATDPSVIVLDESVASLDRATQSHVLDLLIRLQQERQMSYLFISHDLAAVRYISDDVAVMYLGEVVESGTAEQVVRAPEHPYTKALRSAVVVADPVVQRTRERIVLSGDPPDPANPPAGCGFASRCAHVMEICRTIAPDFVELADGRRARCHLVDAAGLVSAAVDGREEKS